MKGLKVKVIEVILFMSKYSTISLYSTGVVKNFLSLLSWKYVAAEVELFIHKHMLYSRQQEIRSSGLEALLYHAGMKSLRSSGMNEKSLNKIHQG